MTTYILLQNVKAVQARPGGAVQPQNVAKPEGGGYNINSPPYQQTFQAILTGIGACSVTVQLMVSNDDGASRNWVPYMDPITASGASVDITPAQAASGGSQPWTRYAAYVTAISGTNASVELLMSV